MDPLPDPASRLLDSIEVLEERHLDEFCTIFKRRLLRFRNVAPSLIKRFACSVYIEYIENSLLDKQNRVRFSFYLVLLQLFYVNVKNGSYHWVSSVYKAYSVASTLAMSSLCRTDLHQCCRAHITSSFLFFFRSRTESLISNYYCVNAPDARRYHLKRIEEEFGDLVEY